MGFEILEQYSDVTKQVYSFWKAAVINHHVGATQEIDRLLERAIPETVSIFNGNGRHMFRARIIENFKKIHLGKRDDLFSGSSGIYGFHASEMGAPPIQFTSEGRANAADVSYLYLSSSQETACAEVQAICNDLISVAAFELKSNLQLADFREIPDDLSSFTGKDDPSKIVDTAFLDSVIYFFSCPVGKRNGDIYKYSQYIANNFKNNGIRGIIYNSSHDDKAYNIVLFDPSDAQCISEFGEVFRCFSVTSKYQSVSQNYSSSNLDVLEVKREDRQYLWSSTLVLYRDINEIQKQKSGE